VLAGGDGTRLASLTTTAPGTTVPKQFCSLSGPRSLLRLALDRAEGLVPLPRLLAVVSTGHRCWWEPELVGLSRDNIVVQPSNRGTAPGILMPLLRLAERSPESIVAVLPSDHYFGAERILATALASATRVARSRPSRVVLLGLTPTSPDPGFGWIVPGRRLSDGAAPVSCFREKPDAVEAALLMERGALLSSFVLVASSRALLSAFEEHLPELTAIFRAATSSPPSLTEARWDEIYATLPSSDFSRDVLEPISHRLLVWPVPPCGWSDLGTPERVAACLRRSRSVVGGPVPPSAARASARPPLELELRLAGVTATFGR